MPVRLLYSAEPASSLRSSCTALSAIRGTQRSTATAQSAKGLNRDTAVYNTNESYVSWREKLKGSWYVETLDDVLDQFSRKLDLQTMLVMVADRVSGKGTYKQIPGMFNFLRKRFFFRTY
ncbi:hypothetical protein GDO81_010632 [Engystomops pustulosus]|uniref:Caspase family p10 domain-containing protein n=1 Tax=Engystomops pustulosus TaxID=76066 RepID=A0AAV7C1H5_ENGPU|nr:hypothetical protein GDO81_010632 [Engystomops pustulosus]